MSFRRLGNTEDTGKGTRTCAQQASVHTRHSAERTHATVHAARPIAEKMRQRPLGTHNPAHRVGGFRGASQEALGLLLLTLAVGTLGRNGTQRASNGSALYGRALLGRICPVPCCGSISTTVARRNPLASLTWGVQPQRQTSWLCSGTAVLSVSKWKNHLTDAEGRAKAVRKAPNPEGTPRVCILIIFAHTTTYRSGSLDTSRSRSIPVGSKTGHLQYDR
jgi:hypothetical protein